MIQYIDSDLERVYLCDDQTFAGDSPGTEQELSDFISGDTRDAVLDFSKVKRINSMTLSLLIRVKKKYAENGRHLGINNTNESVHNIITIAGLKSFLLED